MSTINDAKNRTLTLKRTFNAPLALVWEAWTQSEHIAQWWGPKGLEVTVVEHNFIVGGNWKYSVQMPDGNVFIADGVYTEIVQHKKIVSTANFKPMTEGVEIQAIFDADGNKTHFTFNCVHETEEYCKQQEEMGFYNGWGSFFDRLGEFLEK
ncbi:activator of HSP90 ATPase [Flagellimonas hymeniacidonis]|uniref:Activator of HSP90 ATPase n=1 Tax=Flagellimonas hymeniacidonis TaxID=2603628 RepID=A0A5C8V1Y5_9FLAO|nr:SRPBCC domain-containing protein [Flagellimonas hymeniacidonis]TXN35361.1 activator of HSP90 ATPase [Flagellimonas hymeniacidonis]